MVANITSALGNAAAQTKQAQEKNAAAPSDTFANMVKGAINETAQSQRTAEAMSMAVANGEDVPMHKVIESITRAEVQLQTMVSVRDKAVEAYQEVLRMPI